MSKAMAIIEVGGPFDGTHELPPINLWRWWGKLLPDETTEIFAAMTEGLVRVVYAHEYRDTKALNGVWTYTLPLAGGTITVTIPEPESPPIPDQPLLDDVSKGPGDCLHDVILKWVGEGPTRECGCTDRINQMNAWGPAGCTEHLEEIVNWLMDEAAKRGWWKLAAMLPGSRMVVRKMVSAAIDASEQATAASP